MSKAIKINMNGSYKLGMNEVEGLEEAIKAAIRPVRDLIRQKAYCDRDLECEPVEYKSRDGFIARMHNCGGLSVGLQVPECESYDWNCLKFGEAEINPDTQEPYENDGELDAYLHIWFKFEGINDKGELEFYLNASGGNNDAPYFRFSNLPTLFEASFTCKSVVGVKRAAAKHIKALLKLLGDE